MKCAKYNKGNVLPEYLEKDGFMVPCVPANFERLGILVRVDAIPDQGKTITESHGEFVNGQWVEVIDEQLTPQEIETAEKTAKTTFSKLAIRRAMRALGMEDALNNAIQQNTVFAADWQDAVEINLTDEIVSSAILAAGFTSADINAIKLKIAEINLEE